METNDRDARCDNSPHAEVLSENPCEPRSFPRFLSATDWLAFGVTVALAFIGYCFTLAPDVTLGFSGIFSTAAMHGGVAHPPGYPLWTCYAWVFTKLIPFGNVAWRVAISSATATALACGLIAMMVSRDGAALLNQLSGERKFSLREQQWTRVVSGCVAGLVFGFSGAVWERAVIADVWPLTLLLLTAFLFLMRRWIHAPTRKRVFCAAMLVYGLGLTNSHALITLAPAIPFLAWAGDRRVARDLFFIFAIFSPLIIFRMAVDYGFFYVVARPTDLFFGLLIFMATAALVLAAVLIWKTRGALTEWKLLLGGGASMLIGLCVYFYVPLASMTNPPMNWAYPRTVAGFAHTISRGQYERVSPTPNVAALKKQMSAYFVSVSKDFGTVHVLPMLLLLWVGRKLESPHRGWIVALAVAYVCFAILLICIVNPALDKQSQSLTKVFHSLSYVPLSLWLGYGVIAAVALFGRHPQNPK